jgi:predicted ATPase
LLADACRQMGQRAAGLEALAEAQAVIRATGVRGFEARAHRIQGRLLLLGAEPDAAGAENSFREAIGIARRQGARLSELRAAVDLARLQRDRGQRGAAHDLVAPLYTRFSEGLDTADLRDAAALLDELAGQAAIRGGRAED